MQREQRAAHRAERRAEQAIARAAAGVLTPSEPAHERASDAEHEIGEHEHRRARDRDRQWPRSPSRAPIARRERGAEHHRGGVGEHEGRDPQPCRERAAPRSRRDTDGEHDRCERIQPHRRRIVRARTVLKDRIPMGRAFSRSEPKVERRPSRWPRPAGCVTEGPAGRERGFLDAQARHPQDEADRDDRTRLRRPRHDQGDDPRRHERGAAQLLARHTRRAPQAARDGASGRATSSARTSR